MTLRFVLGSRKLFGTWANMLTAIFKRAISCKRGKHVLYVYNIHEHMFYYVDMCVAMLEKDCRPTLKVGPTA